MSKCKDDLEKLINRVVSGEDFDTKAIRMVDELNALQKEMEVAEAAIDSMRPEQATARLSKLRNKYHRLLKKYNRMVSKDYAGIELSNAFSGGK